MWVSKQTTILDSFFSHRSLCSPALADRAPAATKLGQLPAMGGAGLCLGLSGMPISGWAAVPSFSWLSFVYASFHLASGQAPDLLRSPLFPSSYLEGGVAKALFLSLAETVSLPSLPERTLPHLSLGLLLSALSLGFSPQKNNIFLDKFFSCTV